jgi:hypothetical protein
MRSFACLALFACLLAPAHATADVTPCRDPDAKTDAHVRTRLAFDRQGGETVATAVSIPSLPFTDTGATCDNANDYDQVCPYDGSTAPDVVYSLNLAFATEVVVDLCGSAYDTKVYVLDEALTVVACNDDYYNSSGECGLYVSRIDHLQLVPRLTYYIVVDGYGDDCGAYVLNVREQGPPCVMICPPGSALEGEPPLVPNYEDHHNGGCCGGDDDAFQYLWGYDNGVRNFCGRSGWYSFQGSAFRETDWFIATIGPGGVIEIRGDAEYETYLFELGPQDCSSVGVMQLVSIGPCAEGVLTVTGQPGATVWLWTGPTTFEPPDGSELLEYGYVLWMTGLASSGLTGVFDGGDVEPTTWSDVKSLYH